MSPPPRTLVDALSRQVVAGPDRPVFRFLDQGDAVSASLDFAGLHAAAARVAAALPATVQPGDRVLLLHAPGLAFIAAFFGCLMRGAVAVPLQAPRRLQSLAKLQAVVRDCAPVLALADDATTPLLAERLGGTEASDLRLPVQATGVDASPFDPPAFGRAPAGGDLAFLQYTSGSTGRPKGVRVSHDNILANSAMIARAFAHDRDTVMVGWLPMFHDMGLIGTVIQPVVTGFLSVLMPPAAFLQKPMRWLRAVSAHQATTSGGPNFGYELCVQRLRAVDLDAVDLSHWRVAFNGAEPVRAITLDAFSAAFAPWGLRRSALRPCYGMAEATLLVSGGPVDTPPRIARLDATRLEQGQAQPAAPGDRAVELVGCGQVQPAPDVPAPVAVVHPGTHRRCADGEVGEVWLRGAHVTSGYWDGPDGLAGGADGPFGTLDGQRWLRSGDLGLMLDGELYLCSRLKDLIILKGRNLHPHDLEAAVAAAHPAFDATGGAAFTVDTPTGERLVMLQELTREARHAADGTAAADLRDAARAALSREFDVQLHDIVFLPPLALPRTSSGKVRRRACHALYLDRQAGRTPTLP